MIDLEKFFRNHFDSQKLSDAAIRKFTEDHLQRLAAEDEMGRYTALLSATKDAYDAYFGSLSEEDTRFAVQQSLTSSMNRVVEEFKKTISQKEGIVRGTFGADSPVYQEFFPKGLTEYSRATLAEIETLMNRIITAAQEHADQLGEAFVSLFSDIRARFVAAREAQLKKFGEVQEHKKRTATNRDALEEQLMVNVLTLARDNVGDPAVVSRYFDQTIL